MLIVFQSCNVIAQPGDDSLGLQLFFRLMVEWWCRYNSGQAAACHT
jgi:hypothetical protein